MNQPLHNPLDTSDNDMAVEEVRRSSRTRRVSARICQVIGSNAVQEQSVASKKKEGEGSKAETVAIPTENCFSS